MTIYSIEQELLVLESRAIATYGPAGINVVPVSTMYIRGGKIWLINYFLGKTLENIMKNPHVALTCWSGFKGYQIKGEVEYLTEGNIYVEACSRVSKTLPDRIVKGVLVLTPIEIYDVSPVVSSQI